MHLWDQLLFKATHTVDLLRQSCLNPQLSAEAQLNGQFALKRTPMAPPGTRVIVHSKPCYRRPWDAHGVDGWYVSHTPEHYRCYQVYVTITRSQPMADTVKFFPSHLYMPKTSSAGRSAFAALDLADALQISPCCSLCHLWPSQTSCSRTTCRTPPNCSRQAHHHSSAATCTNRYSNSTVASCPVTSEGACPRLIPQSSPSPCSTSKGGRFASPHCYNKRLSPHLEVPVALANHVATITNTPLLR
jgi:hypothetical protein